ncbi:hypothetical protein P8452_61781 [Trifolium repens]|nr:hypothetical protein P8452_61781 [Trifolium repens]
MSHSLSFLFLCFDGKTYKLKEFHIIKLLLEKLYFITSISSKPRHGLFHDAFICKLFGGGFSCSKFLVVLVRS